MRIARWAALAGAVLLLAGPGRAQHVTDGVFTSGAEWSGPFVVTAQFSTVQVGSQQNGGSTLYVERVPGVTDGGILFLMYDFTNSPALGLNPGNSFFDVFFEIPNEGEDYVVRILPGTDNFVAVEKANNTTSSQNPDGSFNLSDPVWSPLSAADLAAAQFHTAIGFGPSPDLATSHLQAEFQLTVQKAGFGGFYSPEPAFWSAGVGGRGNPGATSVDDPPISSAIFILDPAGGPVTTVIPVLGPNGSPIAQPQADVPEPATALLAGLGLLGGIGGGWRRRRR
jgi:hypothetical protein